MIMLIIKLYNNCSLEIRDKSVLSLGVTLYKNEVSGGTMLFLFKFY